MIQSLNRLSSKFNKNHRSTSTLQKSLTRYSEFTAKIQSNQHGETLQAQHGMQNVQKLQFANIFEIMNSKNKINLHLKFSEPRYANRGKPKIMCYLPAFTPRRGAVTKNGQKERANNAPHTNSNCTLHRTFMN